MSQVLYLYDNHLLMTFPHLQHQISAPDSTESSLPLNAGGLLLPSLFLPIQITLTLKSQSQPHLGLKYFTFSNAHIHGQVQ